MVQNSQQQSEFGNSLSSVTVEPLLSVPDDGTNLDRAKNERKENNASFPSTVCRIIT